MTDRPADGAGWFAGVDPDDADAARESIATGTAERPRDWPARAVEAGFARNESDYYDRLHEATIDAAAAAVAEREAADDQQLIHAVRAMDDAARTANELAERVQAWAGSRGLSAEGGVDGARALVDDEAGDAESGDAEGRAAESIDPTADPAARELQALAENVVALADRADGLRAHVERTAPAVAPNLSALAGPVLAARLIALAGGLGDLAKQPSGTVQVLGAEDALFAHLRGSAPSPKHGVIYTHEAIQGTHPDDRGSAARALAGKLSIAARIDHYSGDLRPELQDDLADRIATIQARTGDASGRSAPGDASDESVAGDASDEAAPGDASDESVAGDTSDESVAGDASDESVAGDASDESVAGDASDGAAPGDRSDGGDDR